ncbi:hypothetical protein ANN_06246 [Periplaneta americana]|uniref:Uncharacterized protein n=1 Tax=Periplaneta americana TaxID=6978 RepID=A0ABQ8TES2_PERAM|nr:hypothetical protein ANN_06246 [Periplaneta americana]
MSILRKIMQKTRRDKVTSEEIIMRLNIEAIGDLVNRRRKEWNHHVSRMTPDRTVCIGRNNLSAEGKKSPGRPKKRWKDS